MRYKCKQYKIQLNNDFILLANSCEISYFIDIFTCLLGNKEIKINTLIHSTTKTTNKGKQISVSYSKSKRCFVINCTNIDCSILNDLDVII